MTPPSPPKKYRPKLAGALGRICRMCLTYHRSTMSLGCIWLHGSPCSSRISETPQVLNHTIVSYRIVWLPIPRGSLSIRVKSVCTTGRRPHKLWPCLYCSCTCACTCSCTDRLLFAFAFAIAIALTLAVRTRFLSCQAPVPTIPRILRPTVTSHRLPFFLSRTPNTCTPAVPGSLRNSPVLLPLGQDIQARPFSSTRIPMLRSLPTSKRSQSSSSTPGHFYHVPHTARAPRNL